jgi:F-type H+-transporting ATPase subunit gamma
VSQSREVKRRIRSVENTRQITRTMEMVATSKLKRATDRVRGARPYGDALQEMVESLYNPALSEAYPILRRPEELRRAIVILLTSNRGLAGGFNVNLIRRTRALLAELRGQGVEVELHVAGKKGIAFFRFQGEPMAEQRTDISDRPSPEEAESLVREPLQRFEEGRVDAVWVVASEFRSAMSTPPVARKLLPIEPEGERVDPENFILSPSGDEILSRILPLYVRNLVFRALVENAASEQSARRTAMKNATDNAGDMLESLRRTYNRARQAQITQEIAEIVGGAAAFE